MELGKNLVGQYELISHGTFDSQGTFQPTNDEVQGLLVYGAHGELTVHIQFGKEQLEPKDLLAYVGTYQVVSDHEVIHKIRLCSQRARNGGDEARNYRIDGENLILSANLSDGRRFEAIWKKI